MPWLYRLQTRAGLTGPEGTAAVVLVLALAGGLAAQRFQAAEAPVAPAFYAAADAAFVAAGTPASVAAPASLIAEVPGTPADSATAIVPDSTSAEAWDVAPEAAAATVEAATAIVQASARRSSGRKPPPVPTNVNTATAEQLQRLPRIGPALAGRILDYRREHGRFGSAAELIQVKGIGEKTMELLAPYVHV